MISARTSIFETFRPDIIASLAMTWWDGDLLEPVEHHLVIAKAPSPTKEALSNGLLSGELIRDGAGLSGVLELTAEGRYLVRRMKIQIRRRLPGNETVAS